MKTRTALVACVDTSDGAWALIKGNEKGLSISELADGERVSLELKGANPGVPREKYFFAEEGSFPIEFNRRFACYRVGKISCPGMIGKPTTVEIILNGKN